MSFRRMFFKKMEKNENKKKTCKNYIKFEKSFFANFRYYEMTLE